MTERTRRRLGSTRTIGIAIAIVGSPLAAQSVTGNVYGTVSDPQGSRLPGVTVRLSGLGASRQQITEADGRFRFLGLDPGEWTLEAELEGFGAVAQPGVVVGVGRNTTIPLTLAPTLAETVTVSAESPLLDERKLIAGTHIRQVELEKIPTARDPWAILNQAPGVLVDRINVGGSESGQQSSFRAPGTAFQQNEFQLDGTSITDMRALGASSTYYDFDQFAEMQFATGGTDVTKPTAGVSVNLVTKRGGNELRGSARFFSVKAKGFFGGALEQSRPDVGPEDMGPGQDFESYRSPQIREIEEVGFEAGGPIRRDRVWLWGSWSENDIRQNASSGAADDTVLENQSLKLNVQPVPSNSAVASWNNGDKLKFGREASVTRPPPTTYDQRGPSAHYRFEDAHVVSSNLFLVGTWAIGDLGFQLASKGGVGPDAPESWRRSDGVWQDNINSGSAVGRNEEWKVDASYFFDVAGASHELKVGGRLRRYESFEDFAWPGREIFRYNTTSTSFLIAKRGLAAPVSLEYGSLWAQDTITRGRFTLNLGLRYDDQSGVNEAYTVPANPALPRVLPALDYQGSNEEFAWDRISPRIGFTAALGKGRQTLIRASLAQFADQLGVGSVQRTSPVGLAYAYFIAPFVDGPPPADVSAFDDPRLVAFANGFDPADPAALSSPNQVDPGLDAPLTRELLLSVEHALRPELVVGLNLTYRELSDLLEERDLARFPDGEIRTLRADDFQPVGLVTRDIPSPITGGAPESFTRELFDLRPGVRATGGSLLINGSREREYEGVAITVTKRLADRWMLRGYLNWGEAEWRVDDEYLRNSDPNRSTPGGDVDGDLYITPSGGGGRGIRYVQSSYTSNLAGMVQIAPDRPWGFNLSGNVQFREGTVVPPQEFFTVGSAGDAILFVDDLDRYRLDDVGTLDLRVEKEFNLTGAVNLTFGIDCFNVTNEGTELSRQNDVGSTSAFWLLDNVSPRVYRLSARIGWK